MTQRTEKPTAALDIWAMYDEEGSYVVSSAEEDLSDAWDITHGVTPTNSRTIHLTLTVPLPRTVEAAATLPDETDGEADLALTVEG